jgi:hypothetical protein
VPGGEGGRSSPMRSQIFEVSGEPMHVSICGVSSGVCGEVSGVTTVRFRRPLLLRMVLRMVLRMPRVSSTAKEDGGAELR